MPNPWHLNYADTALEFGSIASGYVLSKAPDLGSLDVRNDDAVIPRGDGVVFGADYFGGRTIGFELTVSGSDEADVRARLAVLTKAWRADPVRQTPGAVAELVSDTGRLTYGRPRRFGTSDELLPFGVSEVICDFACADSIWYGPESTSTVPYAPAPGGGLIAPLASPLSTTATSDRSTAFVVGGTVPTWPVFEIAGPITNPVIEVVGLYSMEFRLTLAYDETLVIDTRPWARTILRNEASVAGSLTRASVRLSQAALPPAAYELVLRGVSSTATASATARWRDAHLTP